MKLLDDDLERVPHGWRRCWSSDSLFCQRCGEVMTREDYIAESRAIGGIYAVDCRNLAYQKAAGRDEPAGAPATIKEMTPNG
jgi:hypothetical protein